MSRRGRRRSQGGGPPTSHGAARLWAAARSIVLRTSDLRAGPHAHAPRHARSCREQEVRSGWGWALGLRTLSLLMGEKCEPTGTSALPGWGTSDLAWGRQALGSSTQCHAARWHSHGGGPLATGFASNPHQNGAAIMTLKTCVTHSPRPSTSSRLHAHRPQAYCHTPPTADLRPRTGASAPVQQHAQACCDPPTFALGPEAQGPRHAKSCRDPSLRLPFSGAC